MTNATMKAYRDYAETVTSAGSYQLVSRKTGAVMMFGLTKERAERYVERYPRMYTMRAA